MYSNDEISAKKLLYKKNMSRKIWNTIIFRTLKILKVFDFNSSWLLQQLSAVHEMFLMWENRPKVLVINIHE